jgi:hypothetical protein
MSLWGQDLLFDFTNTDAIYTNALDCGRPGSFYKWAGSMAKSHPEDRGYLCRLLPCHEISMRLYGIFEISKKQDLTPCLCSISKRRI